VGSWLPGSCPEEEEEEVSISSESNVRHKKEIKVPDYICALKRQSQSLN